MNIYKKGTPLEIYEASFDKDSKVYRVFEVLRDEQWHCRECEYTHIGITQIAGGSGIQGLERGTQKRLGINIKSDNHLCPNCKRTTRHDRWQGSFRSAVQSASMPNTFVNRVLKLLGKRDVVDNTERPASQLTIDHKLPMIRWNKTTSQEQVSYSNMNDDDIKRNFQLLKKSNGSISHNLLKSRTCEKCFKNGQRGTPFGIDFFYEGDKQWRGASKQDAAGCVGCGWYDFEEWRKCLNKNLRK